MSTKTLVRVIDDTPEKTVIATIDRALHEDFQHVHKSEEKYWNGGVSVEWAIIHGGIDREEEPTPRQYSYFHLHNLPIKEEMIPFTLKILVI